MRKTISSTMLIAAMAVVPASADVVAIQAGRDNTLCEDATGARSNGTGSYLFVGRTDNGVKRRALIAFELSAVPLGAVINSVDLRLDMSRTRAAGQLISMHRVTTVWGEGTSNAPGEEGDCANATAGDATWLHSSSPGTPWGSAGGDFVATASAATTVAATGAYSWTGAGLKADVEAWLATPATNFGWILIGNESVDKTAKRFDSRENPVTGVRPELIVDFTVGSAGPTLFESMSNDPCTIIAPANGIGSGPSPLSANSGTGTLLHYQIDLDADCSTVGPALLKLVKGPGGVVASF